MASFKIELMLFSSQYRAFVQLLAIALHSFLLGIVVLASVPQVSEREGVNRPAHASRLAALHDQIHGRALNRGVKPYDSPSPGAFFASARFRQAQVQQAALLSFPINDGFCRQPTLGFLPIRSPPRQLPL